MILQLHKKKIVAASVLALLAVIFFMLPFALKPLFEITIRSNGFPKAHINSVRFIPHGIYIDQILLDPNGFTTVDNVEIEGSWLKIIFNQSVERISIKNISISGELDNRNRITVAGWNGIFGSKTPSQKPLPFQSLYIDGVTADFDTPIGALRLQGKLNIDMNEQGLRTITAMAFSSQQQLTTNLNFKGALDTQNALSGKIDIEDTSIDISPASVSRLSGWIEFKSSPFTASGQIMAGGLKYNDLPFEDGNLTFDTTNDTIGIFQTKMTGQNLNLHTELLAKPERKLLATISASNLGTLASLADIENDMLSKSGKVDIKAAVKLNDQLLPEKTISVDAIKTSLAGGILNIRPFIWYGDGRKNTIVLDLKNMKLAALVGDDAPVTATGSVSGTIPVTYQGADVTINNGILKSDAPASFKYTPKEMPAALQGNDPRMETVRLALSDYHYETLEVTLDGPLNGNLKTTFKAKGKSPAFQNRPVNLNLNLEGALAAALSQALQPGALGNKIGSSFTEDKR